MSSRSWMTILMPAGTSSADARNKARLKEPRRRLPAIPMTSYSDRVHLPGDELKMIIRREIGFGAFSRASGLQLVGADRQIAERQGRLSRTETEPELGAEWRNRTSSSPARLGPGRPSSPALGSTTYSCPLRG